MRYERVEFVNEVVARLRELEPTIKITFEPGWQTRGNGSTPDWLGMIGHHTGSASSFTRPFPTQRMLITGRPDLSGPLCNSATPWSLVTPWVHVVAAGVANHAGASAKSGRVGKNLGPLPATGAFNSKVWGNESDYSGMEPPPAGTRYAMLLIARAVTDVINGNISYARFHFETSVTGKWDAGIAPGVSMNGGLFRAEAAVIRFVPPVPVAPRPIEEDDMFTVEDKALLERVSNQISSAYFYKLDAPGTPEHGSIRETNGIEQWHVPDEVDLADRIYVLTAMGITPKMFLDGRFVAFGSKEAIFATPGATNPDAFGRFIG